MAKHKGDSVVYRILLCDDNEEHLNILEEYIKNVLKNNKAYAGGSGTVEHVPKLL